MRFHICKLSLIFATLIPFVALGGEGESIVLDPVTGNYVITHFSDSRQEFERIIYVPATKINPQIKVRFNVDGEDIIRYRYKLRSGNDSKQSIVGLLLDPVSSVATPMPDVPLNAPPGEIMSDMRNVANYFEKPASWKSMMTYSNGQMSFRIGWLIKVANGLSPGSQADFGFSSRDLPGIIQARVDGYAPDRRDIDGEEIPENPDDPGDDPFWKQYFVITFNDFVSHPVAVPTIAVPNPFDAALLLDRISTEMQTWPAKQMLDTAFSAQLDRYFQSAISAYRLNQPQVGKKHLETMREYIKQQQPDADKEEGNHPVATPPALIDPLAARVLFFDLDYVMERGSK